MACGFNGNRGLSGFPQCQPTSTGGIEPAEAEVPGPFASLICQSLTTRATFVAFELLHTVAIVPHAATREFGTLVSPNQDLASRSAARSSITQPSEASRASSLATANPASRPRFIK